MHLRAINSGRKCSNNVYDLLTLANILWVRFLLFQFTVTKDNIIPISFVILYLIVQRYCDDINMLRYSVYNVSQSAARKMILCPARNRMNKKVMAAVRSSQWNMRLPCPHKILLNTLLVSPAGTFLKDASRGREIVRGNVLRGPPAYS